MTTICYRQYDDKEFLSYYTCKSMAEGARECEELNKNHPARLWYGEQIDWNKIKEFFVSEQDLMD